MTSPCPAHPVQPAVSYPRRFLRLHQVEELTGFKRSHIYNLIKAGKFPAQVKLGARAVAWDSVSIDMWQNEMLGSTARSLIPSEMHTLYHP